MRYGTSWKSALNLREAHDDQVRFVETDALVRLAIRTVADRKGLKLAREQHTGEST